jgi:glycosyltransferase involved in cell wall biosynthesis
MPEQLAHSIANEHTSRGTLPANILRRTKILRVLCWSEFFRPYVGGVEVLASRLFPALAARGHQITVITSHEHLRLPDVEEFEGIRIRRFPFRPVLRAGDGSAIFRLIAEVPAFIRSLAPDLIHVFHIGASLLYARAIVRVGTPVLLTLHNDLRASDPSEAGIVREMLGLATWITTCSETLCAQLRKTVPELASKTSAIPNAVEPPLDRPSLPPPGSTAPPLPGPPGSAERLRRRGQRVRTTA